MRIFLPPSETKRTPTRGRPLDLGELAFPVLAGDRGEVIDRVAAAAERPEAAEIFGVSEALLPQVRATAQLRSAPAAEAWTVYEGVLYSALDYSSLPPAAKRRAGSQVLVFSALFGAVSLKDRIPAYRASGSTKIPGLDGALNRHWRSRLAAPLSEYCDGHLIVDARSGTYASMFAGPAEQTVAVDVVQRRGGELKVVSHFAKHARGELVRELLADGLAPRSPEELADWAAGRWDVDLKSARGKSSLVLILPEDHSFAG